ncbi:unnamed protein product [Pleuronectes platessa]|uniref:Uncharacterized protein n=1 Tax=Pleuronectes platessa TaxID=8262 RepID=A0A9N7Y545_PLEPL|nr:unnamed protein product [Pleuronectes platessa]
MKLKEPEDKSRFKFSLSVFRFEHFHEGADISLSKGLRGARSAEDEMLVCLGRNTELGLMRHCVQTQQLRAKRVCRRIHTTRSDQKDPSTFLLKTDSSRKEANTSEPPPWWPADTVLLRLPALLPPLPALLCPAGNLPDRSDSSASSRRARLKTTRHPGRLRPRKCARRCAGHVTCRMNDEEEWSPALPVVRGPIRRGLPAAAAVWLRS